MSAPLAAAGPSAYWFLARGTGVVSLLLLTASVVLGVLGSLRFAAGSRWPRFAIDALHRDVSLLVMVLLVAHILTSVLDSFAPITLLDSVIPFGASYRPLWLGLGALSFDILIALVVSSLVRRRLGYRAWRGVHWFAYASWPVAVLHGLGTGSDTTVWWMLVLTVGCTAAVLIAIWVRIARAEPASPGLRRCAIALTLATPLGMAIFALAGPLQRGWARRAGTPPTLLGSAFVPAAATVGTRSGTRPAAKGASPAGALKLPFSARLAGRVTQTPERGGAILDLAMRLSGGARGRLRVRMGGAPISGGGLSMTGSQVDLLADGLPSVMEGQIVSLQGQQFLAHVASASGSQVNLRANLMIDSQNGTVTGTLSATPAGGGG
jgi:sulfoxide reductase heme-binding subunit YedZ